MLYFRSLASERGCNLDRYKLDTFLRGHSPREELALKKVKVAPDNQYISYSDLDHIEEYLKHEAQKKAYLPQILAFKERISFIKHERFLYGIEHKHPFIELVYVYSGRCIQWINDEYFMLEQGDICLLDTNVIQKIEYCGEDDIIINCMMWKSYFDYTFFLNLEDNDILLSFFSKALQNQKESSHYIIFRTAGEERIHRLMQEAMCEYYNKELFYERNVEYYLSLIFTEMLRSYKKDMSRKYDPLFHHNKITKMLQYIQEHCQTVTLNEVAERFHFNPSYLSRSLKKILGVNFNHIVQEARLKQACRLLIHTSTPVEEIANEVGYSNITYFYRIFHKTYKATPAEYRKENNPFENLEA